MTNSYERFIQAAQDQGLTVRETTAGKQASIQTPGHSGRDQGTSVTYNGDRVLVFCHNGEVEDVLDHLGMTHRDLFDDPKGSTYNYPDGRIVFRSVAKKFRQDGNKQGTSLFGVGSLAQPGPVYICEGENDVLTAINVCEVAAVSQSGGSNNSPSKADWTVLAGRDVVIVRDNDQPGHKRAEKVRAYLDSLTESPASVQVVDVAAGKDLSDHVAAGRGLDEMIPAPTVTPGRFITLESFAGMDWDVPTWAWEPEVNGNPHGAIPVGSVALFAGRPGAGKSSAGRHFAAMISRGILPGCWSGTPHSVAYIAGEESLKYNVIPSLVASGADMGKILHPQVNFTAPDGETEVVALVPEKDMRDLTASLKSKGVKLVIVDPLMEFMGTDADVYKNNEVRAKLKPWSQLAEDIDGVVIAITHLNKSGNGDVVAGINGSSAFGEVARAVFGFAKDPESEEGDRIMSQEKNSIGTEGAAWVYRIESRQITNAEGKAGDFGTFVMVGDSDRTVGEVLRDTSMGFAGESGGGVKPFVLALLEGEGGVAPAAKIKSEVTEAGYSWKTVQNNRGKWGIATRKAESGWVWELESTPKNLGFTPVPKVPEDNKGPHMRDLGILGSSMVTGVNQGPEGARSQGPVHKEEPGPSPKYPPEVTFRQPKLSGDTELEDMVIGSLHAEYPMGMKTVEQSVTPRYRDQVPAVLDKLVTDGLVIRDDKGRYTLNSVKDTAA
ncbi:AAA family ATPase [Corynebacterium halotolerans]|uniref:AAA family ATPase n=1 Tax=Corynebacterium halotolerans TaxID=225326 RepID=UPI003CE83362